MNRWRIIKTDTAYEVREHTADGAFGGEIAKAVASPVEAIASYNAYQKMQGVLSAEDVLWNRTYTETFAETDDDLMARLAADGAVAKAKIVGYKKSADGDALVAGWGLIYGSKTNLDLHDTYFDKNTQLLLEYFEGAPLYYEHGLDHAYGDDPIGKRVSTRVFPRGVWSVHRLHPDHRLFPRTESEAKSGVLKLSSDTMGLHVVPRMRKDGGYGSWPLAGWSLTKDPAEPALGQVGMKRRKLFSGIKLPVPAVSKHGEAQKAQTSDAEAGQGTAVSSTAKTKDVTTMKLNELIAALAEAFEVKPEAAEVKSALLELRSDFDDREDNEELSADELEMFSLDEGATVLAGKSVIGSLLKQIEPRKINIKALGKATNLLQRSRPADVDDEDDEEDPAQNDDDEDEDDTNTRTDRRANGKSTTYTTKREAPYQHRKLKMPGITQLVMGVLEGKSRAYMKSLGFINGTNGGWLVRREMSNTMLPRFYADTILDKLGATVVPMPGIETLMYRKEKNGMDAYWRGERQSSSETDPDYGFVQLNLKELVAATTIPKRLLRSENVNLEQRLMDDMAKACRLKYDLAALTGTGGVSSGSSGSEPLGLLNNPDVTKTSLGTNGAVPTPDDFLKRWLALYQEDLPASDTWGVAMSQREDLVIKNTRDMTGQLLEPTAFTQGYRVATTSQISVNGTKGTSTDVSNIYFGDWQYMVVGQGQDVEFTVSEHVEVKKGLVYLEASVLVDIVPAYTEAFEILQDARGFIL